MTAAALTGILANPYLAQCMKYSDVPEEEEIWAALAVDIADAAIARLDETSAERHQGLPITRRPP